MKIARLTDRFIIKLGEISVEVSPMSGKEKVEMGGFSTWKEGKLITDKPRQEHFIIKHTVKNILGVTDTRGEDYKLSFDGNVLTDDCADEVLGLLASTWFPVATVQLAQNSLGAVINPITGKALDGVEIALKGDIAAEEVEEKK